jgi:hypothetical protein
MEKDWRLWGLPSVALGIGARVHSEKFAKFLIKGFYFDNRPRIFSYINESSGE